MDGLEDWVREPLWASAIANLNAQLADDLSNVAELCRGIPLEIFGQILLDPCKWMPDAGRLLPTMPPEEVQNQWTGRAGAPLLAQSVEFIRIILQAAATKGLDVGRCQVLDFGVGWGRLARLWLKFSPPSMLDGCDAWDSSIELSRSCGIRNRLVRSHPLLEELPFPEETYDIAWAFSIFTHLSPAAMKSTLSGLRRMLRPGGLLVFTIRPASYWGLPVPQQILSEATPDRSLIDDKFTFVQHLSDDPYFGDISMSQGALTELCDQAGLRIVQKEWSVGDPYQISVVTARD